MKFKKRSNAFLILLGALFVFSIISMVFSFNSLTKDIVYVTGFFIALILAFYYRNSKEKGG
jgi:hypothetical protein